MSNLIDELIDVLEKEALIYSDILKISKDKTNIIIKNKISELEQIVKVEQTLILQAGRLEDKREELTDKIFKNLNISPEDRSLSELLKHIHGSPCEKLQAAREDILKAMKELKVSNGHNSKLIKNSLEFINFSINLIAGADTGNNNYGSTGHVGETKKRNFFDRKF